MLNIKDIKSADDFIAVIILGIYFVAIRRKK